MTDKEVMQMALDVIETYGLDYMHGLSKKYYVITLRARLEQPEREWVGLTEEEKAEIQMLKWWDWEDTFDLDGYTRAIEAKLKEKNG
jgi:hypothetical protein